MKTARAFTIVELLIVIVVIAILAAVTIVAYNGIQDRAMVTQQTAALQQYANAYNRYTVESGQYAYPNFTSSGNYGCIYPATNCYTGWSSTHTSQLATNLQDKAVANITFNNLAFLNYGAPVAGSTFNGQYFYVAFSKSSSCPSIGGLQYLSGFQNGTTMICRYAPQVLL